MDATSLAEACAAWKQALGPEQVRTDAETLAAYEANVSGLERRIAAVLRPGSTAEVQLIVETAAQHRTPLYPISGGKNWGLGSRLPPQSGAVVVDLGGLNRIRQVNAEGHYAVIEPGVTQRQLYEYLRREQLPLMLNVIGSGLETSLLGNALDRGIGYFAMRSDSLCSLEVVLGNGKLLKTGFSHYQGAAAQHVYKYGLGPYLDGLFCQSNFGIVTAATIDLMPQPECQVAMLASITDPGRLGALVDRLGELRRREVLRTIVHVGNRARSEVTIAPLIRDYLVDAKGLAAAPARELALELFDRGGFGEWSAVGGIMGERAQVKAARREIRLTLRGLAKVTFITPAALARAKAIASRLEFIPFFRRRLPLVHAIEPLLGLTQGIPTDAALGSVYWPLDDRPPASGNPDHSRSGLLYCLPFLPLRGDAAEKTVALCERICGEHDLTPYITLNLADSKAIEGVVSIAFDRRDPARTQAAHTCVEQLQEALIQEGFTPYRLGLQSMARLISKDDPFWQTVRDLKEVLDPAHIIAPGRYNLV